MLLIKLFLTFAKIGLFTVGGGYAMIPFIQKEAVEVNKWISKKDMLEIISLDTVTPGPISVKLATFIGYKVYGPLGSVVATLGVILPSLILVMIALDHAPLRISFLAGLDNFRQAMANSSLVPF